jgi:hypothetical protein
MARVVAIGIVLAATGLFTVVGFQNVRTTDAQIEAGAPEDTLGIGIYPVLALLGIPAGISLAWLWRNVVGVRRATTTVLSLAFLAAVIFSVWSYYLLRARVFR